MNKRELLAGASRAAAAGLAFTVLGTGLAACTKVKDTPKFNSIDITGADYAKDFKLKDMRGLERTLADFRGKVVLVFFGYAQCPDVCPTTMIEMKKVKAELGADGDRFQVIYVTVDPERDTPEVLKEYMANFDPTFLALIPTPEQLPDTAKHFKVYYKKNEGRTPTSYTMDHTATSYLYDPKGRLRLASRYGAPAEGLVADIRQLLKQG